MPKAKPNRGDAKYAKEVLPLLRRGVLCRQSYAGFRFDPIGINRTNGRHDYFIDRRRPIWNHLLLRVFGRHLKKGCHMNGLIYLVGLVVVIMAILSFFGLR
jgi:hypothetical protein